VLPAGLCTELGSACFESGGYAASDGYILLVEYRGAHVVLSLSIEWINLLRTSDMVFDRNVSQWSSLLQTFRWL